MALATSSWIRDSLRAAWLLTCLMVYDIAASRAWEGGFLLRLAQYGQTYLPFLVLSPWVFRTTRAYRLDQRPRARALGAQLLALVLFVATFFTLRGLLSALFGWIPLAKAFGERTGYWIHLGWLVFVLLTAFAHLQVFQAEARERALREARLETQLAQARLQSLMAQIQPHFLFNTHSAISALMSSDPTTARRMLNLLSEFLRRSLQERSVQVVPLRKELEFTGQYLEIQQLRFADRLTLHQDLEEAVLDWPVPQLCLQPLVENAFKHGLGPKPGPGQLEILARREGALLCLEVLDDGVGPKGGTGGTGLRNLQERLAQLYGGAATLQWGARSGGGFRVTLRLPLEGRP